MIARVVTPRRRVIPSPAAEIRPLRPIHKKCAVGIWSIHYRVSARSRARLAVALTSASSVVYGNTSNAFGGQLQKLVGWQAAKTDAEVAAFMKSLAY